MQIIGFVCAATIFMLCLFLIVGGYILQSDRYWGRVWREQGKPDVESIKALKELIKN